MKDYIACDNCFKRTSLYKAYPEIFKSIEKYPINKIKVDKRKLSYANDVREKDVDIIVSEFLLEAWEPIFISEEGYLIDGQHRLAAARKMKLKYLDVIQINQKNMK